MLMSTPSRLLFSTMLLLGMIASRSRAQDIQVEDISFVDAEHGWVATAEPNPAVFRTSDGGKTWSHFPIASEHGFYRIHFFDRNTGVAIASESEQKSSIYRTADAGQTWTRVNEIRTSPGEVIVDPSLNSRAEGFLVGQGEYGGPLILQLLDGGRTVRVRTDVAHLSGKAAFAVFGDGTGHIWIAGDGFILHSLDGGKKWKKQSPTPNPTEFTTWSGTALPGGHAWVTIASEIYRTDDYGQHWTRALATSGAGKVDFERISFLNLRKGCALGNSELIYCTTDGGSTWSESSVFHEVPTSSSSPFPRLQLFESSHGWASVDGALYKTEDGGRTFAEVLTKSAPVESSVSGEFEALKTWINGPTQLAYDKDGFLYIVEDMQGRLLRLDLKHSSIRTVLPEPEGGLWKDFDYPNAIAADQKGHLFIADFNGRLRKLDTHSGDITVLLPAPQTESEGLYDIPPDAMAVDGQENLLITEDPKLFRWRPGATKREAVAGTGYGGFAGDGGLATKAKLNFPGGVAVNNGGDIFIADYANCRIRKIDAKTQIITSIAGTGECASKGDGGLALNAALNYPSSIVLDSAGNLFFVEGATDRVRRIDGQGVITTYAGTGQKGFGGDGAPADKAELNNPSGLAVDPEGDLYISEYVNNRIRRVDALTHIITTVAGNGKPERHDIVM
jgi:photosystem II stability/assembly factor-like uncharacterized protein/sugar lactone lactonase YvrE